MATIVLSICDAYSVVGSVLPVLIASLIVDEPDLSHRAISCAATRQPMRRMAPTIIGGVTATHFSFNLN